MESGAREVPPTLTVQNDLIWTVLTLIGILPANIHADRGYTCVCSTQTNYAS
jgi:hypothetical protein